MPVPVATDETAPAPDETMPARRRLRVSRPSWLRRPAWARLPGWARFRRRDVTVPDYGRRGVIAASLPVGLVAAVAGIVSYNHIVALGMRTHQGYTDSHLLPVAIDGLIVGGSVILAFGSQLGWIAVSLGICATLFANLQFGLPYGTLPAVVSTWPAIAFTVATFTLERWVASQRKARRRAEGTSGYDAISAALASLRDTLAAGNPWSQNQLVTQFRLTRQEAKEVRARCGLNGQAAGAVS